MTSLSHDRTEEGISKWPIFDRTEEGINEWLIFDETEKGFSLMRAICIQLQ